SGAAWFRHQARVARQPQNKITDQPDSPIVRPNRIDNLENTFDLFSGGRAISENLQLDRVLQRIGKKEETVALDTLEGIKVAEIDWKPLIKGLEHALDPLAKLVPADQHVVL